MDQSEVPTVEWEQIRAWSACSEEQGSWAVAYSHGRSPQILSNNAPTILYKFWELPSSGPSTDFLWGWSLCLGHSRTDSLVLKPLQGCLRSWLWINAVLKAEPSVSGLVDSGAGFLQGRPGLPYFYRSPWAWSWCSCVKVVLLIVTHQFVCFYQLWIYCSCFSSVISNLRVK